MVAPATLDRLTMAPAAAGTHLAVAFTRSASASGYLMMIIGVQVRHDGIVLQ